MRLVGLVMACYEGSYGILIGLTKSTDHPSRCFRGEPKVLLVHLRLQDRYFE